MFIGYEELLVANTHKTHIYANSAQKFCMFSEKNSEK